MRRSDRALAFIDEYSPLSSTNANATSMLGDLMHMFRDYPDMGSFNKALADARKRFQTQVRKEADSTPLTR